MCQQRGLLHSKRLPTCFLIVQIMLSCLIPATLDRDPHEGFYSWGRERDSGAGRRREREDGDTGGRTETREGGPSLLVSVPGFLLILLVQALGLLTREGLSILCSVSY